jgi:hypothetical protein
MGLGVANLKRLCQQSVVELKFKRRQKKIGFPANRRMLCTLNVQLLNGDIGKNILNFTRPTSSPPYNAESKGLVVVWDIIMQNWRAIPSESCEVATVFNLNTKSDQAKFFNFFDKVVLKMTASQKKIFMDK